VQSSYIARPPQTSPTRRRPVHRCTYPSTAHSDTKLVKASGGDLHFILIQTGAPNLLKKCFEQFGWRTRCQKAHRIQTFCCCPRPHKNDCLAQLVSIPENVALEDLVLVGHVMHQHLVLFDNVQRQFFLLYVHTLGSRHNLNRSRTSRTCGDRRYWTLSEYHAATKASQEDNQSNL
jgi:hypothetical protein